MSSLRISEESGKIKLREGELMATQGTPTIDFGTIYGYSGDGVAHLVLGTESGRFQSAMPNIANTPQEHRPLPRLCTVCSEAIPAARLKAQPHATKCVQCLTAQGDVPLLRRFDENSADGTVETLFTHNVNLERQLHRQRQTVPGFRAENEGPTFYEEYFTAATQDADVTVAEPDAEKEL